MTRDPALDGIRALACLAVIACHEAVPGFDWGGSAGVAAFFVLSSYLVSRQVLAPGLSVRRFWRSRWRRLFPPLLLLVPVVDGGYLLAHPEGAAQAAGWSAMVLTFTEDARGPLHATLGLLGNCWTLGVEAEFYLIWPMAFPWIVRRAGPHVARAALVAGAVACLLLPPSTALRTAPFLLGSALALGCPPAPRWIRAALGWRPLASLGLLSYGLYLWHYPIARAVMAEPLDVRLPLSLALALLMAGLSYITVERWTGSAREPLDFTLRGHEKKAQLAPGQLNRGQTPRSRA